MTRGKQKIEAQRKNADKNQKAKGSQLEARAVGLKVICPICKVITFLPHCFAAYISMNAFYGFIVCMHVFHCVFLDSSFN